MIETELFSMKLNKKMGSGGFAVVYKVKMSNRAVAVKMVERQDDSLMVEAAVISQDLASKCAKSAWFWGA